MLNPTAQVRQRSALSDEIVYHDVAVPFPNIARESGLASKATVSVRTCVINDISLHDGSLASDTQFVPEKCRQRNRNGVDPVALTGMRTDQRGPAFPADFCNQRPHSCDTFFVNQIKEQPCRSLDVARFRGGIFRMPLRIGFGG